MILKEYHRDLLRTAPLHRNLPKSVERMKGFHEMQAKGFFKPAPGRPKGPAVGWPRQLTPVGKAAKRLLDELDEA